MASPAPHHGIEPGAGRHERACLQQKTYLRPLLWQKNGHQLPLEGSWPRWSKKCALSVAASCLVHAGWPNSRRHHLFIHFP